MPRGRTWALWEPRLYYEDRTIQHAGVVLGLGQHRTAGHSHYRVSSNNLGYMGRLCYAQNADGGDGSLPDDEEGAV